MILSQIFFFIKRICKIVSRDRYAKDKSFVTSYIIDTYIYMYAYIYIYIYIYIYVYIYYILLYKYIYNIYISKLPRNVIVRLSYLIFGAEIARARKRF